MTSEADAPGFALRLDASDFELFELPLRFAQDRALIDARWKALMARMHPDRFAAAGAQAQCEAMQWALRVNQAYVRLKKPLARAAYLCELHGQAVDAETNTAMPAAFLMQQMAWREALADAATVGAVEAIAAAVAAAERRILDALASLLDERRDWVAAAAEVRALMFLARFGQALEQRLDALHERAG